MKSVLIFRDTILPCSETFIQQQAQALTRYQFAYTGFYPAQPTLVAPGNALLLQPDKSLGSTLRGFAYRRLGFGSAFRHVLRGHDAALIHAHFAPDGVHAIPLAELLKVPLIVTLHGYDVTMNHLPGQIYRELWQRASVFLCVSEYIRQAALKLGFPKAKLHVQYIGIDEESFVAAPGTSGATVPGSVLFIGRLVPKKGCEYLLDAMQRVQSVVPDAQLTIIGDGPLRRSLEQQATRSGIHAHFVGTQNSASIRQYLQHTSVFCVPSVTAENGDSEGFGIVFIEAQAMGVPVVSFRHGGVPEAVAHGLTGLLADERSVDLLTQHLLTYLQDEDRRRIAGQAGRERVLREFSLRRRTAELESMYDEVLAARTS